MVALASTEITQQEFAEFIRKNCKKTVAERGWLKRHKR
jgi:hypothetical protein